MRGRPDPVLLGCAALGALGIAAAAVGPDRVPTVATAPLGIALVLAAPGWSLQSLLAPPRLGTAERIVMALLCSLAVAAAAAIALSESGIGIGRAGVLASVGAVTLALAAAGAARGGGATSRPPAMLLAAIAIGAGGAALVGLYAARSTPALAPASGFTLLGVHRASGDAVFDVASSEAAPTIFHLRAVVGGRTVLEQTFRLVPGARERFAVPAARTDLVEGYLSRADSPGITYRRVRLQGS